MPLSVKKKKTVVYSTIIILILIFGVIFPAYHVYNNILKTQPAITVKDGYYNATYSGNFRLDSNIHEYPFSTNESRAIVIDTGHPNSTLDVSAYNGVIFYLNAPDNVVNIIFNLSVSGHFTSNLHPKSLTISCGALGANQSSVMLNTWAPPYSSWVPVAKNLSPDTLGNLVLVGPGNVSVTTSLLNQSNSVPFYNFYVSVQMWLTVKWYEGSSHLFDFSAQANGLCKPVNSTLSMTIVEVS